MSMYDKNPALGLTLPENPYTYLGLKIYVDNNAMSISQEDWSKSRSPSRAKRRLKRGFKQHVIYRKVPDPRIIRFEDKLFMHSDIYKEFVRKIEQSKNSNPSSDFSFQDRSKSESPKYNQWGNHFWNGGIRIPDFTWISNQVQL